MGLPVVKNTSYSLLFNDGISTDELDFEFFYNFDSLHTRKCYARDIKIFFNYINHNFNDVKALQAIRRSHIVAYKNFLNAQSYAPKTICRKMAATSSYFSHLMEKSVIDSNPFDGVSRPNQTVVSETNDLTDKEVESLFKVLSTYSEDSISGKLHQAIIYLLFSTGIRKSELINLKKKELEKNGDFWTIRVRAKGGKFLTKVIHKNCYKKIKLYLDWMETKGRKVFEDDYLFQPTRNPIDPNKLNRPLDPKAIDYIIKHWTKKAGITKRISPHSARATYIGSALESGVDLYLIAKDVGHSSVKTTEEYNKRRMRLTDSPIHKIGFLKEEE